MNRKHCGSQNKQPKTRQNHDHPGKIEEDFPSDYQQCDRTRGKRVASVPVGHGGLHEIQDRQRQHQMQEVIKRHLKPGGIDKIIRQYQGIDGDRPTETQRGQASQHQRGTVPLHSGDTRIESGGEQRQRSRHMAKDRNSRKQGREVSPGRSRYQNLPHLGDIQHGEYKKEHHEKNGNRWTASEHPHVYQRRNPGTGRRDNRCTHGPPLRPVECYLSRRRSSFKIGNESDQNAGAEEEHARQKCGQGVIATSPRHTRYYSGFPEKLQPPGHPDDKEDEEFHNPMVKNKIRLITVAILLVAAVGATHAGDVARFANLGFSPDARVFMFGQYGISHPEGKPFAEIYTVDVPGNVFVSGGVERQAFDRVISGGQDGSGALFTILPRLSSTIKDHAVDHLNQGRIVYLYIDGETDPSPRINFRDFRTDTRYTLSITQRSRGRGPEGSAQFHLDVSARYSDGQVVEKRVGRPGLYRDGVNRYRIGRVIAAPDNRSLVVVIERITDIAGGRRIRYMVETVKLR